MPATPSTVRSIAPEFKGRSDSDINAILSIAEAWLDEEVWGSKYDTGHAYMSAHILAIADREGAGGAIASESVGGVSVGYGSVGGSDEELNSTAYGQMFVSLRRTLVTGPLVRSSCR